jgi:hypothetical protein
VRRAAVDPQLTVEGSLPGPKREYRTISTASRSERDFIDQPLMKTRSLPLAVLIVSMVISHPTLSICTQHLYYLLYNACR